MSSAECSNIKVNLLYRTNSPTFWATTFWTPHALPHAPNADGRPVWEPPMFNYSHLIDEEYEKKRKAMLEWRQGDVVSTTRLMDIDNEVELLEQYLEWVADNFHQEDTESLDFFCGLWKELHTDLREVRSHKLESDYFGYQKKEDGNYEIVGHFGQVLGPGEDQWYLRHWAKYKMDQWVRGPYPSRSASADSDSTSSYKSAIGPAQENSPSEPQHPDSPTAEDDTRSWLTTSASGSDADSTSASESASDSGHDAKRARLE